MANEDPRIQREEVTHRYWDLKFRIGDAMFYAPIAWLLFLVFFPGAGGGRWLAFLPLAWTAFYVFVAPGVVWLAYFADSMPVSRTITALAAGMAPGMLFLPGSAITEKPLIWVTLPALMAWGCAGQYFSLQSLPAGRRGRTSVVALGALACFAGLVGALVALISYRPARTDPPPEQQLAIVISCAFLAAALLFGWQGFRLVRKLRRT